MHEGMNKVAQVTLVFWIMKIAATTLGETGGDLLSMTLNLGYAVSTAVFFGIFLATLVAQVTSRSYHPLMYWAVIISTTTAGTTMSDYLDRTAGLGYIGGSLVRVAILLSILAVWRLAVGSLSVDKIDNPKAESFYWVTILFSNTLGTALGDFLADQTGLGLGYEGGALVIFAVLALIAAAFVVEMTVISFGVLWPVWSWGRRGMEYALLMGIIALAILFRGGGRYSVDHCIGREF